MEYTKYSELIGSVLKYGDYVSFNGYMGRVTDNYIDFEDSSNDRVFKNLGMSETEKWTLAEKIYGYPTTGGWPQYRTYEDCTKLVLELFKRLEIKNMRYEIDGKVMTKAEIKKEIDVINAEIKLMEKIQKWMTKQK